MTAGPQSQTSPVNVVTPSSFSLLYRFGRSALDLAALISMAPAMMAASCGLLVAVAIGVFQAGMSLLHSPQSHSSFTLLRDPAIFILCVLTPFALTFAGAIFAWARTGSRWGLGLLLATCATAPFIAQGIAARQPKLLVDSQLLLMSDIGLVLSAALLVGMPAIAAIGSGCMLLSVQTPDPDDPAAARGRWRQLPTTMFASRHSFGRPAFWTSIAWAILQIVLAAFLTALACLAMFSVGAIASLVVLPRLQLAPWALHDDNMLYMQASVAVVSGLLASGFAIADLARYRSTRIPNALAVSAIAVATAYLATDWLRLLARTKASGLDFDGQEFVLFAFTFILFSTRSILARALIRQVERIRRRSARSARELAAIRSEPPILFLRSFTDDEQSVNANDAGLSFALGAPRSSVRIEELVSRIMFAAGPLVAFSNHAMKSAPIGAARDIVPMDAWQEQLMGYLLGSQIVVCFLGRTESFLWEIDQILEADLAHRMILVFSPTYLRDTSMVEHVPRLAGLFGFETATQERDVMSGARAMAFNPRTERFDVFTSRAADALGYEEAILNCALNVSGLR